MGETVTVCGLGIEHRLFSQSTGETTKFITICDYGGILECEVFAGAYRRYGINTVRYPVVELTGRVTKFDNAPGCLLEVQKSANRARLRCDALLSSVRLCAKTIGAGW